MVEKNTDEVVDEIPDYKDQMDKLVVRVSNESCVVDSVVLFLAELGNKITDAIGNVEYLRALVNEMNIHQHQFATAVDVKNVSEMPASYVPLGMTETAVDDGGKSKAKR